MDKESGGFLRRGYTDRTIIRPACDEEWGPAMELAVRTFERYNADDCMEGGRDSFLRFLSDPRLRSLERKGIYRLYVAGEMSSVYTSGGGPETSLKMTGMMLLKEFKHISLLFVDSAARGHGTGRKLVEYAMYTAKSFTGSKNLSVNSSTHAIPFYTGLGFAVTGTPRVGDGLRSTPMVYKENDR